MPVLSRMLDDVGPKPMPSAPSTSDATKPASATSTSSPGVHSTNPIEQVDKRPAPELGPERAVTARSHGSDLDVVVLSAVAGVSAVGGASPRRGSYARRSAQGAPGPREGQSPPEHDRHCPTSLFLGLNCGRRRDREEWSWQSRELPSRPSLEYLRNESQGPPPVSSKATGPDTKLTSAQLAVARSYGFASWPKLREHVETINRYFWPPVEAGSDDEDLDLVERFLAYACLTYSGVEARQRPQDAAALLDAHPEIATASVHAMAAANEADALRAAIAADPTVVERPGGPHRWAPLLYAAYARVPGRSTLDAGACPAGRRCRPERRLPVGRHVPVHRLDWCARRRRGRTQPRHPDGIAFARLLLEAGANPNDTQAIYNGTFLPDDAHLELLFEFGLGTATQARGRPASGPAPHQSRTTSSSTWSGPPDTASSTGCASCSTTASIRTAGRTIEPRTTARLRAGRNGRQPRDRRAPPCCGRRAAGARARRAFRCCLHAGRPRGGRGPSHRRAGPPRRATTSAAHTGGRSSAAATPSASCSTSGSTSTPSPAAPL